MGNKFLTRLKKEGKLELVEPSEEICDSYSEKSSNCLRSAKLLLENRLYENSIGMSYYAMYNLLTALLFKTGIKCENHSASILMLNILFDENKLFKLISDAKKERIDRQYYVTTEEITKEDAQDLLENTENFILKMKVAMAKIDNEHIDAIREKLQKLIF